MFPNIFTSLLSRIFSLLFVKNILLSETNDCRNNTTSNFNGCESSDQLFDSISSDILREISEKDDVLGSLPTPPKTSCEFDKDELEWLDNFQPMTEMWNDKGNKINKQRIDLTMPADQIVCAFFANFFGCTQCNLT